MSRAQLHKRLDEETIVTILERYLSKDVSVEEAMQYLSLKRARFFRLLRAYRHGDNFSMAYKRRTTKRISTKAEEQIITELEGEKRLIENRNLPVWTYNYSAVQDVLQKNGMTVSVPTIIARAKEHGYYQFKKPKKIHDREVVTNFVGELVQHDSSHHLFSPYMEDKLYLITSIDDYSRLLLFADFFETESTWLHIEAVKSVVLQYGSPFKYYADQHSIFRYVKDRDKNSPWRSYTKFTDDVNPQWKQVLLNCGSDVTYALSPQAKGKVERPYRWIQDRIVRTAAKAHITTIDEMRSELKQLVDLYNTHWVHSTTKEIPIIRFERALHEQKSLFKPLLVVKPEIDIDDIFCLRTERIVDAYRKISLDGITISVPKGIPRQVVDLHIIPIPQKNIAHIRFWQAGNLLGTQYVPLNQLKTIVHF